MCNELLMALAKNLVNEPDAVTISSREKEDGTLVLELHVAPGDMGRVIGKQGRIAKAIRIVMKAAATKENIRLLVDIVD